MDFVEAQNENPDMMLKLKEKLNEIAYLFKSAEYQYEHGPRLILESYVLENEVDIGFMPPKVYVETIIITPFIASITLGPKVERAQEWASAFYYKLEKRGFSPKISISHLPFK